MASRLSMVLVLFGVIALARGQVKKEGSSRLSQILRADHEMKDTDMLSKQLEQGEVEGVDSQPPLTADELANMLSLNILPTRRFKRQAGGRWVLGDDFTHLGSRRDSNGGLHSLLGHYEREGPSIGAGYQYGTSDGRSAFGVGVSYRYRRGAKQAN